MYGSKYASPDLFFVSGTRQELPVHIPHTCNYIAVSLCYPVLCTKVMEVYQNYSIYQEQLSRILPNRQCIENYLKDLSLSLNSACYLYNEKYQLLLYSRTGNEDDVMNTDFIAGGLEKKPSCVVLDPTYGVTLFWNSRPFITGHLSSICMPHRFF